jgi:phospholipid/cholesterol/gamma-HCH transport system substrate-binding protein
MENRSHALIAGLFTLVLGLAVAASIMWFGGQREATQDYVVVTRQNVTGLSPQGSVRYRGMGVGKVQSIVLDPQDVRNILIRISVSDAVPITRGTTARIGYQGITGIAHIQLGDSGADPAPLVGEGGAGELPRLTLQPSLIDELSLVGGEALHQARDVLVRINQVLNAENRERIAKTLANLEATTAVAQETLSRLQPLVSTENLRIFKSTLVRAEQAVGQAGPFFAEARVLVGRLQAASDKFEAALGDSATGGVGALAPRLNELSLDVSSASRQLNRVLQQFEAAPQSLVFGGPSALPGPGEAGFSLPASAGGLGGPP